MRPFFVLLQSFYAFTICVWVGCSHQGSTHHVDNPAAAGFDLKNSDPMAIKIADDVMATMGGQAAWDDVETIEWTFFDQRRHRWNKQTGAIEIELLKQATIINMTLGDSTSVRVTRQDTTVDNTNLSQYYQQGKSMWINDSYWLVMPFKIKDTGVRLTYVDSISYSERGWADRLRLTFSEVGDTPENAYVITIPRDSKLVERWDFYRNATDTVPSFSTPWEDYKPYGDILLSGDRGRGQLTDIAVSMVSKK